MFLGGFQARPALSLAALLSLTGCAGQNRPLTGVQFACDDATALEHPTLASPAKGGPAWRELTSPHFTLRTDLPSRCALATMAEYEQTYAALKELGFPFEGDPPGRVVLTMFARVRDFKQLIPDPGVAGRFSYSASPWENGKSSVMRWYDLGSMRETFTHELTHHFVRFYYSQVPVWVNEGLADFYETMDVTGGKAELGADNRGTRQLKPTRYEVLLGSGMTDHPTDMRGRHRYTLTTEMLPSIRELDAMTAVEFYGYAAEGEEARTKVTFRNYTGAWAVVHFLRTGPQKYRTMFDAYLRLLAGGKSHRAAWESAFSGTTTMEIERAMLERLDDQHTPGLRTDYTYPPAPKIAERLMTDAEVHLAWIKARALRVGDAPVGEDALDVEQALKSAPNDPEALFARARLELMSGQPEAAEADARRAMQLRPDEIRYVEGLVLIYTRLPPKDGEAQADAQKRLEELLPRLTSPNASPSALNTFAWIAAKRGRPEEGIGPSMRSVQNDPGCWECYDTLAALLYQKNDIEAAIGAQQLAMNLLPERAQVPAIGRRLQQYKAALVAKRRASDPTSWKPPPIDLR